MSKAVTPSKRSIQLEPPSDHIHIPRAMGLKHFYLKQRLTYGDYAISQFKKKRVYYRALILNGRSYQYYNGIASNPLYAIRNTKFCSKISIYYALFAPHRCFDDIYDFLRKLPKIKVVELKFENIYTWNMQIALKQIKALVSSIRQKIPGLKIHFSFECDPVQFLRPTNWMVMRYLYSPCRPRSFSLIFKDEMLSLLTINSNNQEDALDKGSKLSKLESKFQRVKCIHSLQLMFLTANSYHILPRLGLSHLDRLQNLELTSLSSSCNEDLLINLQTIQPLNSLTLHHQIDLGSLVKLLRSTKAPRNLIIRGELLNVDKYDGDSSGSKNRDNKNPGTTCLHLDFKYLLKDVEQVKFLSEFLSLFNNLEDLKICLVIRGEEDFLGGLGITINRLTQLKQLTLGLIVVTLDGRIPQFLSHLRDIVSLQSFLLMIRTPNITDEFWGDLRSFILQNKSLKKLELYWNYFNVTCLNQLKPLWENLPKMELIRLSYIIDESDHGEIHEKVLSKLEKTLQKVSNVERIEVITSCSYRTLINCESLGQVLAKRMEKGTNIRHFYFNNESEVKTPFFNDSLSN